MPFNYKLVSVLAAVALSGCGGGGGGSSESPTTVVPPADVTAPTLEVSASDLMIDAGATLDFEVAATDSSGFGTTTLVCSAGELSTSTATAATTQTVMATFVAPASDAIVTCTATSADSVGNAGTLDFSITVNAVDNEAPSLTISQADLTVGAGETLIFDVIATDMSGFTDAVVTCSEGTVTTSTTTDGDTQTTVTTFEAPATAGTVTCTATSTDSAENAGSLEFSISVTPVAIVTANFNGTWFSPCFNNGFGFSVRQTIDINGTNLTSAIQSFTAGQTPSPNCVLPDEEGILILSDVTGMLDFQRDIGLAGCINDRAVETDINLQTFDSSGNPTVTSEADIAANIEFVTGFTDILPDTTDICVLDNSNLLFGGVEYTGDANLNLNVIINPDFDIGSDVIWSFGDNDYEASITSSGVDVGDGTIGVLVVSTANDTSNGAFSGSGLNFTHTLQGSGVYRVTTLTEVITADSEDETAKLIVINGTVGTGTNTGTTGYGSSENNGFVIAVVDDAGLYHFSTDQPLTLDQTLEVDGGVEGAPASFALEMTNIFDFQQ